MPPGNSNNKASVRNKCSYCGKSSCKGESSHSNLIYDPVYNQFHAPVTYTTERNVVQQTRPSVNSVSVSPRQILAESSQSIRSSAGVRNALLQESSIAEAKVSVDGGSLYQTNQKSVLQGFYNLSTTSSVHSTKKTVVLKGTLNPSSNVSSTSSSQSKKETVVLSGNLNLFGSGHSNKETVDLKGTLNPSSTVGSTSSSQSKKETVVLSDNLNLFGSVGIKTALPEKKGDVTDSVQYLEKEIKSNKPNINIDDDKVCFNHSVPVKLNKSELHQSTAQFSAVDKDVQERKTFNKSVNDCSLGYSECQSSLNDAINLKLTQNKHSGKAAIYEGIVVKILDTRTAKLRVGNADVEPKFVQLFVDNLLPSRNEFAYTLNTDIKSVLSIGQIVTLICTEHNKKNSGFQLFAHEAWKTEKRNLQRNNNNDAQSVTSYVSHGSVHGSESSKFNRSRKRSKIETAECNSYDLSDAIYQWLDRSESLQSNRNASKSAVLVEGCDYTGTVIELRLPYAFIVEVSINKDVEHIYGLARNFYPEGPNSPSAALGISIRDLMNVKDEVIVRPYRSAQPKEGNFTWVAKMAWPIMRNIRSNQSDIVGMQRKSEQLSEKFENLVQQDGAVTFSSNSKNDRDGEILSLQSSWGLVKEVGKGSAYVFTRKNAFLFGLSLKTFVLEDIFQEGQLVKFSLEDGESGLMHAKLVWCGNSSPNYNSLYKTLLGYCRARKIKSFIEISLVQLGEEFYKNK